MSKKNTFKEAAIAAGEHTFFDGVPCRNGHVSDRYTRNSGCTECAKIAGRGRQITDNIRENAKRFRDNNKDKISEYYRKYIAINKEKAYAKQKEWRQNNPDRVRENVNKWQRANKDTVNAMAAKRRARKRNADGKYTAKDIERLFANQRGKCASCTVKLKKSGKDKFHVDHVMPLALGGSNWPNNLQLLCPGCNVKKSAKDPLDWAQENGRLL